jgi:hypothetical protein
MEDGVMVGMLAAAVDAMVLAQENGVGEAYKS